MLDTTDFVPHGKHLIGGEWVVGETTVSSDPAAGEGHEVSAGTPAPVGRACNAAEQAFLSYGYSSREERASFLEAIADAIEQRADAVTAIGTVETGLPQARLQGERGRTTGQLRLFANHIRDGAYLDRRHDEAQPERTPAPRLDLRMMQRPIGPVAVFGSSNFPLAFSTAGGDTAAALAAGCPVVFKGHPAHPGTAEVVAEAIHAAMRTCGVHAGAFSLVYGATREVGEALVQHPLIKAVGFTGSYTGGRALFDLCARRPEPIPFYGEMGSVNPMFILPQAAHARSEDIGAGWAGSLTMGVGQFCTRPGIAVIERGERGDAFVAAAHSALNEVGEQLMLTQGIAQAYRSGCARLQGHAAVRTLLSSDSEGRAAAPDLFETDASAFLQDHELGEEIFGPAGLVVRVTDADEMGALAQGLNGQLTATLHMDDNDAALARRLLSVLEHKAGRVLANGFPTGVEVTDTMVHGGPYPATTNFGATSVGTLAIRRFLRPVCYQNIPESVLPDDLA